MKAIVLIKKFQKIKNRSLKFCCEETKVENFDERRLLPELGKSTTKKKWKK